MELTLMNYRNDKVSVDIGDREDIGTIFISIISGDEIAHITYKDFSQKRFDSNELLGELRLMDFDDGCYMLYNINECYMLYNINEKDNLLDNPKWINRTSSYDDSFDESEAEE